MGSSISTGDNLPAVPNAVVYLIACGTEVWCKASRTNYNAYLPVQRVTIRYITGMYNGKSITYGTVTSMHSACYYADMFRELMHTHMSDPSEC